jgi:hypothetical protein
MWRYRTFEHDVAEQADQPDRGDREAQHQQEQEQVHVVRVGEREEGGGRDDRKDRPQERAAERGAGRDAGRRAGICHRRGDAPGYGVVVLGRCVDDEQGPPAVPERDPAAAGVAGRTEAAVERDLRRLLGHRHETRSGRTRLAGGEPRDGREAVDRAGPAVHQLAPNPLVVHREAEAHVPAEDDRHRGEAHQGQGDADRGEEQEHGSDRVPLALRGEQHGHQDADDEHRHAEREDRVPDDLAIAQQRDVDLPLVRCHAHLCRRPSLGTRGFALECRFVVSHRSVPRPAPGVPEPPRIRSPHANRQRSAWWTPAGSLRRPGQPPMADA